MPSRAITKEVEECLTCPLCTNLFDRPTTISECLHTFCRDCIHDKFTTQKLKACPVCNVDLGVFPLDKLRSDYNLENMRLKLFPAKTEGVKAGPDQTVAASLKSSKKKEKSLTSLLESSSRVSFSPDSPLEPTNVVVEEKRIEIVQALPHIQSSAKPLEPTNVVVEKKQIEIVQALPHIQSSAKPIITFKKRDRNASVLTKNDSGVDSEQPQKEAEVKKVHPFDLNNEPDNGLDEAEASISQDCIPKEVAPPNINDTPVTGGDTEEGEDPTNENCVVNRETDEVPVQVSQNTILISSDRDTEEASGQILKNNGKGKQECAASSSRKKKGKKQVEKIYSLRPRKDGRTINPAASTPEVAISVEGEKSVEGRNNNSVWFTLVPSKTHNTEMLLPGIKVGYLRVKDRYMTVSHVKKYIMVKLGLDSEDQVEIWLRNEPVSSSQTLNNLADWWVQTTPLPARRSATVGSSAAYFVMVLSYSFKSEFSGSE